MPQIDAAQMNTTQTLPEDVLLITDAPGKKMNSPWALWMGGSF